MRARNKAGVGLFVMAMALSIVLWNVSASSSPAMSVSDAKRDAGALQNRTLGVRGSVMEASIVVAGSIVESFVITDASESLLVLFNRTPPDNFGPKEVMVFGSLRLDPDGPVAFEATSIQVGCSSKY